jgi:hypothetical protein
VIEGRRCYTIVTRWHRGEEGEEEGEGRLHGREQAKDIKEVDGVLGDEGVEGGTALFPGKETKAVALLGVGGRVSDSNEVAFLERTGNIELGEGRSSVPLDAVVASVVICATRAKREAGRTGGEPVAGRK